MAGAGTHQLRDAKTSFQGLIESEITYPICSAVQYKVHANSFPLAQGHKKVGAPSEAPTLTNRL